MSYLAAKPYNIKFTKSLVDRNKSFRLVQLSNGLLTLLISDPATDVAASAVCVATGSHNDPEHTLGLAHLCEHMLFLGTKQFPHPNEFFDLINSNGGSANAFTTGEQTCFHFELTINGNLYNDEPLFNYALRNFASFFKAPLLNEKDIKNEVLAVEDEHRSNLCDPNKLLFHGLRLSSNKNHPFHRFATGTAQTIIGPKLRSELSKYFDEHYTTENLTLVIKGPQSLNHLQKLAIASFSDTRARKRDLRSIESRSSQEINHETVPNSPGKIYRYSQDIMTKISNNSKASVGSNDNTRISRDPKSSICSSTISNNSLIPSHSVLHNSFTSKYHGPVFSKDNLNKLTFIQTTTHTKLRLYYPIYNFHEIDKIDFLEHVWCNIIGDESPNTLCSRLKGLGYIESLLVHVQTLSINDKVLCIDVDLTSKGAGKFHDVVELILKYILDLCNGKIEEFPQYLSQLLTIAKLNYYYQDSHKSCMEEVAQLSQFLQLDLERLGAENLIKGSRDLDYGDQMYSGDYKEETKEYWDEIAKLVISVSSETLAMGNYGIIFMGKNENLIKGFLEINGTIGSDSENTAIDPYYGFKYRILSFEPFNYSPSHASINFAAKSLILNQTQIELNTISQKSVVSNYRVKNFSHREHPKLLDYSDHHELWFKRENDANFDSKVLVSFQVQSLEIKPSLFHSIGFELLGIVLGNLLGSTAYPAELAGFSWGLRCNLTGVPGICFTVSGIGNGFDKMLKLFVDEIETFFRVSEVNYRNFMKARVQLRKKYVDLKNSNGIKQALAGSLLMLEEGVWSLDERIEGLEMIGLEDFVSLARKFFLDQKYTRILINGNITHEKGFGLSRILEKATNHHKIQIPRMKLSEPSSYFLKRDYTLAVKNFNREDRLNTVYFYIQTCIRADPIGRAMTYLIAFAIGLQASYELRTKRNLGYTVMSGPRISRETMGIYICVMSTTNELIDIMVEINDFLFEIHRLWVSYDPQQFVLEIINGFLNKDSETDLPENILFGLQHDESSSNFNTESTTYTIHNGYWEKVISKTYRFDGLGEEVDLDYIRQVDQETFLDYFSSHILKSNTSERASLAILISTSMSKDEIERQKLTFQLQLYLQSKGINASNKDIEKTFKVANNNLVTTANHFLKLHNQHLLVVEKYMIKRWTKALKHRERPKLPDGMSVMLHNPQKIHKYCSPVPRTTQDRKLAFFEKNEDDIDFDYDYDW